ncbi:uncharacterized protein LOC117121657 [Anneissia japonica]|uniref:uncharacterized protein LOC117121657 n=1 Tax=Anneissia japonica TaxID=1529436 RepID=UPI0014258679|nr:uncharacterized protein LOC117121657 [Anneissia japonica]
MTKDTTLLILLVSVCLNSAMGSTRPTVKEDVAINEKSNVDFSGLDSVMFDFLRDNHYTGATIGISKGNRLVYTQGYGTTSDHGKMRPTNLLPISSLSKTITAAAILKLYAADQLNMTDRVFGPSGILRSLMPDDSIIKDKRIIGITVEHLLQHTSGWSQMTPLVYDPMMNPVNLARGHNVTNIAIEMGINGILTQQDIIRFMLSKDLESTPGMRFHYSNFGYCILGRVVEAISGMPYEEYIKEEILTPLGMIHTRLGPHYSGHTGGSLKPILNFAEGELDVFTDTTFTTDLYKLWDSTLGWFSTVYDISRFANGLTSGLLVNHTVLSLLRNRPMSLVTTKKERWHGYGVFTDHSHAWWEVGDSHDDEIILHHVRCTKTKKGAKISDQLFCQDKEDFNVVIIMSSNNRKNIKQLSNSLLASVITWPNSDESFYDLGIKIKTDNNNHYDTVVASMISENQIKSVTNVFQRLRYYPYWMDAYVVNHKTLFTVIFKQDNKYKHRVSVSATKHDFNLLVQSNAYDGYHLSFVVSCNSEEDSGRIRHSGTFSTQKQRKEATWWNQAWNKYNPSTINYYKNENYSPVIQSITIHKETKHVTYRFEKQKSKNWKSISDISRDSLARVIKDNALQNRRLQYLDSYVENGELFFSGIFTSDSNQWMVHIDLTETELQEHLHNMSTRNFNPEIIVGYEVDETPMFVVAWKK